MSVLRSRGALRRLFGRDAKAAASRRASRIEHIRQSMLSALGEPAGQSARLDFRIRRATDIRDLWYLRGELMLALAQARGEAAALEAIYAISAEFEGLLPGSFSSWPSPLAG